jgi:hypothetical protein
MNKVRPRTIFFVVFFAGVLFLLEVGKANCNRQPQQPTKKKASSKGRLHEKPGEDYSSFQQNHNSYRIYPERERTTISKSLASSDEQHDEVSHQYNSSSVNNMFLDCCCLTCSACAFSVLFKGTTQRQTPRFQSFEQRILL